MSKYNKGDLVRIADDLGISMQHFECSCDAIVLHSDISNEYGLHIENKGEVAWYNENNLTLIERNRGDLLLEWQTKEELQQKRDSDLEHIFSRGKEILKKPSGTHCIALANSFGFHNMWGSHGEGFVFHGNCLNILAIAEPFLEKNDKQGWLLYCEEAKINKRTEK